MPNPHPGEKENDFMERCVPMMMDEGVKNEQAVATCMNMYRQKTNVLKTISRTPDELRVGNYIILFGGRDLEWVRSGRNPDGSLGEYFTNKTIIESPYTRKGRLDIDYEHGLGKYLDGPDAPGKHDVLGYVDWKTARKDERGWWVERALDRRNKYMKFFEPLIEENLIGTSSEAMEGKTKRAQTGEILEWHLWRDTLAFDPADIRMMAGNQLNTIKTLAQDFPNLKALLESAANADVDAMEQEQARYMSLQLRAKALLLLEKSKWT